MLQFHVPRCRIESNFAHKVRRSIHRFVTSEPASDVEGFIPDRAPVARTNNRIHLRRISAFLPPASWGVSSGGFL